MAGASMQTLGGFAFRIEDRDVAPRPRKARALLGYLAVTGRPSTRERLASLFWGDAGDSNARLSLRKALSTIRSALGPSADSWLQAERSTVELRCEGLCVDALRLLDGEPDASLEVLEDRIALYRGPLLEGLCPEEAAFDHWRSAQQARVHEALERLTTAAVHHHQQRGDEARALALALDLVQADWTRESAHQLVIESYARAGQVGTARAHFERFRAQLSASLGTQPSPRLLAALRDLSEHSPKPKQARSEEESDAPATRQRRQATAMFVSLVAADGVEPEARQAELGLLWHAARGVVEAKEADDAHATPDGFMAVWGTRRAGGDEVDRATAAAQALREVLAEQAMIGSVRIGVASGWVVGSDEPGVPWVGRPLGLAAALAHRADPGGLRLCAETRASLRAGKGSGSLFGRELELLQLRSRLEHAQAKGRGGIVVVRADAGLGKTALCERLTADAADRGVSTIALHASAFGEGDQSGAVGALTRSLAALLLREGGRDVLADVLGTTRAVQVVELLEGRSTEPEASVDPAVTRESRRQLVVALLHAVVERSPLVWIFEDAHWASAGELEDLDLVFEAVTSLPMLAVVTVRRGAEPDDPGWLGALQRRTASTMDLQALDPQDARALAASLLAESSELAERIADRAGGNPLFIEQLARRVVEGQPVDEIPATVRGIVLGRLERLDAQERDAVEMAASLGPRMRVTTLEPLVGAPRVSRLCADGWLRRDGPDLRFAHGLLRDAVYEAMHAQRRLALHVRAAEHYRDGDPVHHAEHLALAAGARAAEAFLLAARHSWTQGHGPHALSLAGRGLELSPDPTTAAALATFVGDVHRWLTQPRPALDAYERAGGYARTSSERVAVWLGEAEALNLVERREEAFDRIEWAMRALRDAPDDGLLARALVLRGNFYFPVGDYAQCVRAHQEALVVARRVGDRAMEGRALTGLGDAEFMGGDLRRSVESFSAVIDTTEDGPLSRSLGAAYLMRGMCTRHLLQFEQCDRDFEQALEHASETGDRRVELMGYHGRAMVAIARGEFDRAVADLERGNAIARRLGARRFEAGGAAFLARALRALGQRERAHAGLLDAREQVRHDSGNFLLPLCLVELAATAGSSKERLRYLAQAEASLTGRQTIPVMADFYATALDVLLDEGCFDRAAAMADEYATYAQAHPFPEADLVIERARLLCALGRTPEDEDARRRLDALRERLSEVGLADPRMAVPQSA